ncbi:hypothetical protein [Coralloluteibacterium thermophilus]|uniref:Uncharacterized protein n=1 Tax=Coralloluteibacterium thermophilum TaxID=2707049 RepID=A0ABV9NG54_9GAMM
MSAWTPGQRRALEAMGFVLHVRRADEAPGQPAPEAPPRQAAGPAPEPVGALPMPAGGEPYAPRLVAALYGAIGAAPAVIEAFPILLPPPAVLRTAAGKRALWPALRRLRRERARR